MFLGSFLHSIFYNNNNMILYDTIEDIFLPREVKGQGQLQNKTHPACIESMSDDWQSGKTYEFNNTLFN